MTIELADADATRALGAQLAAILRGGDAVALIGDLGAGKTTLVAGLCEALAIRGAASPTFALVHEHAGGALIIWHIDLYRIDHARELVELGLDEIIGDPRGVALVEWADRFAVMPADHLRLELSHRGGARTVSATGTGPRGRELVEHLRGG